MSYAEELRANYADVRRRLWGVNTPIVKRPGPPMGYEGRGTGEMWLGVNYPAMERSPVRKGREIIRAVLTVTGVRNMDFLSHRRSYVFVEARQIACWFMRHYTGLSFPQIGYMIGGRDHSTILHAVKRVNARPDIFAKRVREVAHLLRVNLPEEMLFQ